MAARLDSGAAFANGDLCSGVRDTEHRESMTVAPGKLQRTLRTHLGLATACFGTAVAIACTTASTVVTPPPPSPQTASTSPEEAQELSLNLFFRELGWRTNLEKRIVDLADLNASVPRDAIPPIYQPQFESVEAADTWLDDDDVVGVLALKGKAHVYPLRILRWHEVVNDQVGGTPVLVTFCPLCDTFVAFDRRVDGEALTFGVSGILQHSNLVMWDHQTESWWQQVTGTALVGDMAGQQLNFLPVRTLFWPEVRQGIPLAQVLSQEANPTVREAGFYDLKVPPDDYSQELPLWTGGPTSKALRSHERVVGLNLAGMAVAYPLPALAQEQVVNDVVGGWDVVLFYSAESGAGNASGAAARVIDTASVYSPVVNERKLSFSIEEGGILDRQTGSTWAPTGLAISGPLKGSQLEPLVYSISFWFSWVAFYPDTELRLKR